LTQNRMQLARLSWNGQVFDRGSQAWSSHIADCRLRIADSKPGNIPSDVRTAHLANPQSAIRDPQSPLDWIVLNAAFNATGNLEMKNGEPVIIGNTTEGALLLWLRENHLDYQALRLEFAPFYQIHFSSERKRMTTVIRRGDQLVALVKGAPEWIMAQSTHYLD